MSESLLYVKYPGWHPALYAVRYVVPEVLRPAADPLVTDLERRQGVLSLVLPPNF